MDLDIGCKRPLKALLNFEVILPRTIPVGISNDLIFASPRHPFMDLVTHNLVTFNHRYGTNYPTVMFSTGPMFLSAQYGLWPSSDGMGSRTGVRVLPKALYGKNAKPEESVHSFFLHYYGSSWHADDASFVTFVCVLTFDSLRAKFLDIQLGKFGMVILYSGAILLIVGCLRLVYLKRFSSLPAQIAGPISLPFSSSENHPILPAVDGSRSGATTPLGSRPASPLPQSKARRLSAHQLPGPATPGTRGALYWVPFYSSEGAPPYPRPPTPPHNNLAGRETPSWTSYLPAFFAYDSTSNRYQPVSPYGSRPGNTLYSTDNE